ncbi:glucose 1-dehydrogenase [Glycomyces sp. TRM65418]|uniref:glucose 1-dehydrogenase n=1 Tax=Glycomyces sp. TRM65418 TaxID=2867006 RepID=UPI001CE6642A|nr:glucose 1-dehydrogenase [Glycomyces sp. TRM65418]MCC3763444.1 glucose 1-dehydrogenase [Glycomyces sp. TRM65418]QZD57433.1 glucose 1-dehydrogenase [Glycomyces sp. TRM65418]
MRALTIAPGRKRSLELVETEEPTPAAGELLVDGLALGVCGTDKDLIAGEYGWAPPGSDRLVLGHESLGRVRTAPEGSGFAPGDLVVGVVRRPDPVPCGACAHGEFDSCRNGGYVERGIKQLDGYGSEVWTVEAGYAVKIDPALSEVGVLLEPMSVLAKAWEQIDRIGGRAWFEPRSVLVTGAGPIGLLAALVGAQRGLDVHVYDHNEDGPKPKLAADLGVAYHHESMEAAVAKAEPDIVIEATGAPSLVFDAIGATSSFGITCLTGVSSSGRKVGVDAGEVNRDLVLENDVVFGTVNANLDHYAQAARYLAAADRDWLRRIITRRVPLRRFKEAFQGQRGDVKVVIDLQDA